MLRFLAVLREEEHLLRIYAIGLLRVVGGVFPEQGQGDGNQSTYLFSILPSPLGLMLRLVSPFPFQALFGHHLDLGDFLLADLLGGQW